MKIKLIYIYSICLHPPFENPSPSTPALFPVRTVSIKVKFEFTKLIAPPSLLAEFWVKLHETIS